MADKRIAIFLCDEEPRAGMDVSESNCPVIENLYHPEDGFCPYDREEFREQLAELTTSTFGAQVYPVFEDEAEELAEPNEEG